jgi:CheY-like chemotaxis protein
MRMLATDILSEAGFHVLEAAHGKAALDVLESRPDVGMLFSDVDMPLLDGFALARLVAVRWPHVPILTPEGLPLDSKTTRRERRAVLESPHGLQAEPALSRSIRETPVRTRGGAGLAAPPRKPRPLPGGREIPTDSFALARCPTAPKGRTPVLSHP